MSRPARIGFIRHRDPSPVVCPFPVNTLGRLRSTQFELFLVTVSPDGRKPSTSSRLPRRRADGFSAFSLRMVPGVQAMPSILCGRSKRRDQHAFDRVALARDLRPTSAIRMVEVHSA